MKQTDMVTIAILAKDKAHVLPLYLKQSRKRNIPCFQDQALYTDK